MKLNCKFIISVALIACLMYGVIIAKIVLASDHKTQIAFSSGRDGNKEIYVMDADGVNAIRLTHHPAADSHPSWSPDGGRIAFISNRNGGNYQIYVMDSNGINPRRLTQGPRDWFPAWSPDGQTIAFESGGDEEWSSKIHVVSPDGTNLQRLEAGVPSIDRHPTWSPDSQRIAFVSWRGGEGPEIYVMNANGKNRKRLTHNSENERGPSWSPDGSRIAFWTSKNEDTIIAVMDADGANRKELFNEVWDGFAVWNTDPVWSPDGRIIAYRSHTIGLNEGEIHLMTADGEHLGRLGNLHKGGDGHPDWFAPVGLSVSSAGSQPKILGELKEFGARLR
ncbi:MAG: hypothetical protein OXI86_05320 [Candidatus Poribacteria bacterium]|nr:hypothetical protein [Candidatus Poribacteria bacterium]